MLAVGRSGALAVEKLLIIHLFINGQTTDPVFFHANRTNKLELSSSQHLARFVAKDYCSFFRIHVPL
jgi:hypothetical protein